VLASEAKELYNPGSVNFTLRQRRSTSWPEVQVISEDRLIERIIISLRPRRGGAPRSTVRLGVGDDGAVIAARGRAQWVVSSDAFLEGVHFQADTHPADSVGYKALARATSDLAAMGATPRFFLLTFALPANRIGRWLDDFLGGLRRAAHHLGMTLVGGDTTMSSTIFISLTVIGDIAPGRAATRSGANPGDRIYVTGTLGAAQLGLLLTKNRSPKPIDRRLGGPLKAHLYPRIRVQLGAWLARHRLVSAMIDVSDGLSTDLGHLCAASGVGARIRAGCIPMVQLRVRQGQALSRLSPLELALNGGDDYELLFTVRPGNVKHLWRAPQSSELTEIGEIVRGRKLTLVGEDGTTRPLVEGGWDPFRSTK
jgi:thiamine-monophosphate kinase